jgi:SAM-dependent methyltransferase
MNSTLSDIANPATESPEWRAAVQVAPGHYGARYIDWDKWVSFYWQIQAVVATGGRRVLEIGVGSGVVAATLKRCGIDVTTADIDASLAPDVVADACSLPFDDGEFDMVLCCEVLEHMPYEVSVRAARELRRVTHGHCLVSLPHAALSFAALVRMPILHLRELRFRVPFARRLPPGGEHYWECGRPGYPVRRIRRDLLGAGFKLVSESRPPTNYSHVFFLLGAE